MSAVSVLVIDWMVMCFILKANGNAATAGAFAFGVDDFEAAGVEAEFEVDDGAVGAGEGEVVEVDFEAIGEVESFLVEFGVVEEVELVFKAAAAAGLEAKAKALFVGELVEVFVGVFGEEHAGEFVVGFVAFLDFFGLEVFWLRGFERGVDLALFV